MAQNAAAKPPSIKGIARLARASHSTVSRAFRNNPMINRRTVERIRRIARESGHRVRAVARGLVAQETKTMGVVGTSMADPSVGEVVSGINQM
jgi:LacI family transcriptional regulator/LacI family repressor for deo operon, udp, cdd, tsx, nupC, and nupG